MFDELSLEEFCRELDIEIPELFDDVYDDDGNYIGE